MTREKLADIRALAAVSGIKAFIAEDIIELCDTVEAMQDQLAGYQDVVKAIYVRACAITSLCDGGNEN